MIINESILEFSVLSDTAETTFIKNSIIGIMNKLLILTLMMLTCAAAVTYEKVKLLQMDDGKNIGKLMIKILMSNGSSLLLNFRQTEGELANQNTPVYIALGTALPKAQIEFHVLPDAMLRVGSFKMYQDFDNKAAIVMFTHTTGSFVEGLIGTQYILHSVPTVSLNKSLTEDGGHVKKQFKRSVNENDEQSDWINSREYVLITKSPPAEELTEGELERIVEKRAALFLRNQRGSNITAPDVVYPKLLISLDYITTTKKPITGTLKSLLVYWNAVDMLFSNLTNPKVKLSISGIIIPADQYATPFVLKSKGQMRDAVIAEHITSGIKSFYYKYRHAIPDNYDFLIFMTERRLCPTNGINCGITGKIVYIPSYERFIQVDDFTGRAVIGPDCVNKFDDWTQQLNTVAVVRHYEFYDSYATAAHELGHLFSARHDDDYPMCTGILSATHYKGMHELEWSKCAQHSFHKYFMSNDSACMWKKPEPISLVRPQSGYQVATPWNYKPKPSLPSSSQSIYVWSNIINMLLIYYIFVLLH